jgi:hypothetical protein
LCLVISASEFFGSGASPVRADAAPGVSIDAIKTPYSKVQGYAQPGDLVVIDLTGKLPVSSHVTVKFAGVPVDYDGKNYHQDEVHDSFAITVPPVPAAGAPGPREVVLLVDGKVSGTPALLNIATPGPSHVFSIDPYHANPGEKVTVWGNGLYGPKEQMVLNLGAYPATIDAVAPDGTWFTAIVGKPIIDETARGWPIQPTTLTVWGVPASIDPKAVQIVRHADQRIANMWSVLAGAIAAVLALGAAVWLVCRTFARARKRSFLNLLLVDETTNTYSLSKAQFIWWMTIILFGYCFVYLGRGLLDEVWGFPDITDLYETLGASLGTLVVATAVTSYKGPKGAGYPEPHVWDFFVQGNVIALERVQQAAWAFIAGLTFLAVLITSFAVSHKLPSIPKEMVLLMGISSAAYLGGKASRKPGPVINEIEYDAAKGVILVRGSKMSQGRTVKPAQGNVAADASDGGVQVFIGDYEIPGVDVTTFAADPDAPTQFATCLQVLTSGLPKTPDYKVDGQLLKVVNADSQEAIAPIPYPKRGKNSGGPPPAAPPPDASAGVRPPDVQPNPAATRFLESNAQKIGRRLVSRSARDLVVDKIRFTITGVTFDAAGARFAATLATDGDFCKPYPGPRLIQALIDRANLVVRDGSNWTGGKGPVIAATVANESEVRAKFAPG